MSLHILLPNVERWILLKYLLCDVSAWKMSKSERILKPLYPVRLTKAKHRGGHKIVPDQNDTQDTISLTIHGDLKTHRVVSFRLCLTNDFTGWLLLIDLFDHNTKSYLKQWEAVFVVVWRHEEGKRNCNKKQRVRPCPIDNVCASRRPSDQKQPIINRFIY